MNQLPANYKTLEIPLKSYHTGWESSTGSVPIAFPPEFTVPNDLTLSICIFWGKITWWSDQLPQTGFKDVLVFDYPTKTWKYLSNLPWEHKVTHISGRVPRIQFG